MVRMLFSNPNPNPARSVVVTDRGEDAVLAAGARELHAILGAVTEHVAHLVRVRGRGRGRGRSRAILGAVA